MLSTVGSFCTADEHGKHFPCLQGRCGVVKGLLPVMKEVLHTHGKDLADFDKMYDALSGLVDVKNILHDHSKDRILPLAAADSLREDPDVERTSFGSWDRFPIFL